MICPRCQQGVQELSDGLCPYCGYPCEQFHRKVTAVQVILAAIFASTFAYGIIVGVLELAVDYTPPAADLPEHVLGGALLAASIMPVLVLWRLAEGMAADGDPEQMLRSLILMAAAAETPAVSGLAAYLIAGSLIWFAILLGASWALFLRLGMGLPEYLNRLRDSIGETQDDSGR